MTYQRRVADDPGDPDYILKDGEVLRVPFYMMDGAVAVSGTSSTGVADGVRHAPGPAKGALPNGVTVDVSARDTAFAQHLKDLTEGWRTPPKATSAKPNVVEERTDSHAAYESWLRDAWRTP